jgi:hypothetical protein
VPVRAVRRYESHTRAGKCVPLQAMKTYRGSRGIAPLILNLVNVTLRPPYPVAGTAHTDCIGGLVGPTAGLDVSEKSKILYAAGVRTPGYSLRSLLTALSRISNHRLLKEVK